MDFFGSKSFLLTALSPLVPLNLTSHTLTSDTIWHPGWARLKYHHCKVSICVGHCCVKEKKERGNPRELEREPGACTRGQ